MTRPSGGPAPLAVSIGEPSGIGPDLALLVHARRAELSPPPFFVIADPEMLASRAERLGLAAALQPLDTPAQTANAFSRALPVLPLVNRHRDEPGRIDATNAYGTIEAIDRAVRLAMAGEAAGITTLPIDKKALYDCGFAHPGHTEYLAALCEGLTGEAAMPVMMLAGPELSAVPVTIHVPLGDVPGLLTTDLIVKTARIVARDLRERFGIAAPRLAVSGLNPHAGEKGALGAEDDAVIAPAVAALREEGMDAFGPLPADTMFHDRARAGYDVALCMYHDQALIPAKALAFDETVNVTLGLPLIRTSPDHGTAADLAGTGTARPDSFVAALKLAARMAGSAHP